MKTREDKRRDGKTRIEFRGEKIRSGADKRRGESTKFTQKRNSYI